MFLRHPIPVIPATNLLAKAKRRKRRRTTTKNDRRSNHQRPMKVGNRRMSTLSWGPYNLFAEQLRFCADSRAVFSFQSRVLNLCIQSRSVVWFCVKFAMQGLFYVSYYEDYSMYTILASTRGTEDKRRKWILALVIFGALYVENGKLNSTLLSWIAVFRFDILRPFLFKLLLHVCWQFERECKCQLMMVI